ncbi:MULTISPECIES: tRNA uridine-5-carboxymethylaminomethyl(34) synthesis GTPase MnmE [Rhodomicrobium]|uniref:tRNA uridine-5-carboxymethylaminomethyl(34) synthesis GTPase MnmE n=1 Tax=Rhodomicrobium TaxID=1068 RepID=UPI001FD91F24|nr:MULTISPECIES: tRNA uridine-5-carboxymethylaminomethyl(34) synthesis GTPase MnmE [Rhodomicrobium]
MTTIYALSSGHGKSGVAVIRISGPAAGDTLAKLGGSLPQPRVATLRTLRDPADGTIIDHSLTLWFPAPASFTGDDLAEMHVHGGRAVVEALFGALAGMVGLRPAEPGEFTRRAFENGKMDLTEAEGLADLIDAETEAQRRQALRQAGGSLRLLYDGWRLRLIGALASIEAELDFSDEGDVPEEVAAGARSLAGALREEIAAHLADKRGGEILRDGLRVVIAGPPNAGKSSLMNALARRDVAIVSAEAGTTRDVIEVRLDLGGFPVILMDTAGIREAAGEIEREGVRRTLERAQEADLVLWLDDATAPENVSREKFGANGARIIEAVNKVDLAPAGNGGALALSVKTGQGMDRLIERLAAEVRDAADIGENPAISRARHRRELERCAAGLSRFLAGDFAELELRAEDLRDSATALGRLGGRVDVEDILDQIFAEFCIGK